jgi:GTP-sensing pleiotropic transcriptional regulator CodY
MVIELQSEVEQFDRIVSTLGREHLGLRATVVASRVAAIQAVIVAGPKRSAGYACGTSWPRQFERDLAAGQFD